MNLVFLAFALKLPVHVAAGGLRGLLSERSFPLQPLQRPPPATADVAFAQLASEAAPAAGPAASPSGAPGPAPGPAAVVMPTKPNIPKITPDTCKALTGKVATLIGAPGGAGPAPAPAAFLETEGVSGGAPAPPGLNEPHVDCQVYAWVSKTPVGCVCYLQAPGAPAKQPKVAGCPKVPNAIAMGFTGDVVQLGPMGFGGQTGAHKATTCVYRQWFGDPTLEGIAHDYQVKLSEKQTEKWIKDVYSASLKNAWNTAKAFYALTPVPWLKLYPTEAPPPAAGPAPAPAPGPAGPTTPPILHMPDATTNAPMLFTTPFGSGFGAMPFGGYGAAMPYGAPTTAPVYAAVGFR